MELATKINFDKIVLVSPSPLFKDTIKEIKDNFVKEENGDKTIKEMCEKITCPVEIYIGALEKDLMKETAYNIADCLNVDLQIIEGTNHEDKLFEKVLKIESEV